MLPTFFVFVAIAIAFTIFFSRVAAIGDCVLRKIVGGNIFRAFGMTRTAFVSLAIFCVWTRFARKISGTFLFIGGRTCDGLIGRINAYGSSINRLPMQSFTCGICIGIIDKSYKSKPARTTGLAFTNDFGFNDFTKWCEGSMKSVVSCGPC